MILLRLKDHSDSCGLTVGREVKNGIDECLRAAEAGVIIFVVTIQPGLCPVSSVRNSQPVSPLTPVGAPAHGLPLLTGLCAANRSPDGSLAQPPAKELQFAIVSPFRLSRLSALRLTAFLCSLGVAVLTFTGRQNPPPLWNL